MLFLILSLLNCAAAVPHTAFELLPYDPVARSDAMHVTANGKARFTVLTPRVLRLEYSASGRFEDRPTAAVVNRRTPFVPSSAVNGSVMRLQTDALELRFDTSQPFSAHSLNITSRLGAFKPWHYTRAQAAGTWQLGHIAFVGAESYILAIAFVGADC